MSHQFTLNGETLFLTNHFTLWCIIKENTKVDKMEVSKQFPMLKEQLLYKLEGIALHEERRLEENASLLASQVLVSPST